MLALIVVESIFGNTRQVADRVAAELSKTMDVAVYDVANAPDAVSPDVDLLVLGGPTHAFGMTRPRTRDEAGKRPEADVPPRGLREWLDGLDSLPEGIRVAVFDTRVDHPRMPGSAAHSAARKLRRLRAHLTVRPMTFWVRDVDGPLAEGEGARAQRWARTALAGVTAT